MIPWVAPKLGLLMYNVEIMKLHSESVRSLVGWPHVFAPVLIQDATG